MRGLTKRQKNFLTTLYNDKGVRSVEEMHYTDWEILEEMNDWEMLWQCANNYLLDLQFEEVRRG